MSSHVRTSKFLQLGQIYTIDDLLTAFHIRDVTLNNGVFKPKRHASVWLFCYGRKTAEGPIPRQAQGDELLMDGQTLGRTDDLIESHRSADLELLLFRRRKKSEFPKADSGTRAFFDTFQVKVSIGLDSLSNVSR